MKLEAFAKPGSEETLLLESIDADRLPRHIAVIMDGNGRWAGLRKLPRVAGHRAGIDAVRDVVESCRMLGIEALTLYAFSTENWKRPKLEIRTLMRLLKEFIRRETRNINENNIRFQAIGRIHELDESVRDELRRITTLTCLNNGMTLNIALNYSGRAELTDAVNRILSEYVRNGEFPAVTEDAISNSLYTAGLPDPDLLIRTSGEIRISNFLLWQIAYSEIYVTPVLWPDFRRKHLLEAIMAYQLRERRYGGI
jgi:undecaprenyl diphosphate synthase